MKRLFLALLVCGATGQTVSVGIRNAVMPLDWGKETVAQEFKYTNYVFQNKEFGPVTQTLIAGLHQGVSPIIVSASTWRNAIERAKIFADIVGGKDISYLQQYPLFNNPNNLAAFVHDIRKDYDAKNDLLRVSNAYAAVEYYTAYQTFYAKNPVFKPSEWIVKKVSDYIYLLIPQNYIKEVDQRKDTPAIARQLSTSLSPRERLLGMKFEQFADIPAQNLLDVRAHAVSMNYDNYKKLVPSSAYKLIERLRKYKWDEILRGYIFGQHVMQVMPQIFVTRSDLKAPGGNKEETDINEAYFLHEWLVYLDGHGSVSDSGPVMPVVYELVRGPGMTETRAGIAFTAGVEQGAFRELLGFFNNRVHTGALIYTSCYSGGPHLFKLFEHHWDYPKTQKVGKGKGVQVTKYTVASQDIFNYLIIATNLFYQVTTSSTFTYWSDGGYYRRLPGQSLQLANFFNGMARFLHPQPVAQSAKGMGKKQKVSVQQQPLEQQLTTIIKYVHFFDFAKQYQIPAVRFPYTEWFVPLNDVGMEMRLESEQARQAREIQQVQARTLLETIFKQKGVPQKVQESIKKQELKDPALQEKARKEKELLEKQEKDRKEKELFERMEKMRKEQEARAKAQQPQPVKPQVPVQPVTKPKAPLQSQDPNIQLPPVVPPGKKPVQFPTKLPPPPVVQTQPTTGLTQLQQALKALEGSLYHVVTELLR